MTEIIRGLFIGNINHALDPYFIIKHNIRFIVNCTTKNIKYNNSNITTYQIPIKDNKLFQDRLYKMLPNIISIINKHYLNNENILIHCMQGIQRSATIYTAFIIYYMHIALNTAINIILNKYPIAFYNGSNIKFKDILKKYEYSCKI